MLQEQVRIEEARLTKQDPVDMSFFVAEAACRRFKNGKEASFNSAVPNYECICRDILEDVDQCLQKALEVFGEDYVAAGPLQLSAAQELKQAKNKLNEGLETFKKNMTELKGQFDRSANIAEAQKALEKSKDEKSAAQKIHQCVRKDVSVLRSAIRETERGMFEPSSQKKRRVATATEAQPPLNRSDVAVLYMMNNVLEGLPNGLNMKSSIAESEQFHVPV